MGKCLMQTSSEAVFKASCLTPIYKRKRDINESPEEDLDNKPQMFPTIVEPDDDYVGSDVSSEKKNSVNVLNTHTFFLY